MANALEAGATKIRAWELLVSRVRNSADDVAVLLADDVRLCEYGPQMLGETAMLAAAGQ